MLMYLRLLPIALLAASVAAQPPVQKISGNVYNGNQGPLKKGTVYWVQSGGMTVPAGKTLTIQPGAIVKLDKNNFAVVGTLVASRCWITSIEDDAIGGDSSRDGATQGQPGDWMGLEILPAANVTMDGVLVRFAGNTGRPGIWCRGGPVCNLSRVDVAQCRADGISLGFATGKVVGCQIGSCGGFPLIGNFFNANAYSGNRAAGNKVTDDLLLRVSARVPWPNRMFLEKRNSLNGSGVIAIDNGAFSVPAHKVLQIDSGVIVKMPVSAGIRMVGGSLDVRGASGKVVMTNWFDDARGGRFWKNKPVRPPVAGEGPSLVLQRGGGTFASLLASGLELRFAGKRNGFAAIEVFATCSVLVEDSTVFNSAGHGVRITHAKNPKGLHIFRRTTFDRCAGSAVWGIPLDSVAECFGNVAKNCGGNHFAVLSRDITKLVEIGPGNYPGPALAIIDPVRVDDAANGLLRLKAGTVIEGWPVLARRFPLIDVVRGKLEILGEPGNAVVLTSYFQRNDPTRAPKTGDWGGITVGRLARATLRHVWLRYPTDGVRALSPQTDLLGVRVDRGRTGFLVDAALTKPIRSCLAIGCIDGINVRQTVDVHQCTVLNSTGFGIQRSAGTKGRVFNSISWNNAGGNYRNYTASDVFSSIGGFHGKNGNRNVDPRLDSSHRARPGSPAHDAGDPARTGSTRDADGRSRTLDGSLCGTFRPDLGAYEYSPWSSSRSGAAKLGGVVRFGTAGATPGLALFLVGAGGAKPAIAPFGHVNTGIVGLTVLGSKPTGRSFDLGIPSNPGFKGAHFYLQPLVLTAVPQLRGNLLETYAIDIE